MTVLNDKTFKQTIFNLLMKKAHISIPLDYLAKAERAFFSQ